MKKIVLFLYLIFSSYAYATEICTTIDTSSWTTDQKKLKQGTAYNLAFTVGGQDIVPTIDGDSICFKDGSFNVSTVITEATLLNRMAQQKVDNDSETTAIQVLKGELDTISSQLEADDLNWAGLTTAQRLVVMKKILRREVLQRRLNQ